MRDPYLVTGPAVVSFSGGGSSGLMLRRILDAHGGVLPPDVIVLFANTGRESPETLDFVADCASQWSVDIEWAEYDPTREGEYRYVTHETASRDGEPFAALIQKKGMLPNGRLRACTEFLKVRVMAAVMRANGYSRWTNIVGLRADEEHRVANVRARATEWDIAAPLADAHVTKAHVRAFWSAQSFGPPEESNCDLCFLKGRAHRERLVRAKPYLAAWWIEQERLISEKYGRSVRFHANERGYSDLLDRVRRSPSLPLFQGPEEDALPCNCTDRRAPRCGCRDVRRLGHRLACKRVFGRAA